MTAPGRLLKMSDVSREVSLHRATIYRMIARGEFPRGRPISRGRVAWTEAEIETWKQQALTGAFSHAA
ncbi:MAG: AlpA family phage regulatory protein [Methylovirgula sp.]|nr:AlpA family phage regulatory protein [Methylovirgula sp.]